MSSNSVMNSKITPSRRSLVTKCIIDLGFFSGTLSMTNRRRSYYACSLGRDNFQLRLSTQSSPTAHDKVILFATT